MTKTKKTVFAIVNLANTEQQQKNTVQFAVQMAKVFDLDVIIYPQIDETKLPFEEGVRRLSLIAPQIIQMTVRISEERTNMFKSLHDIAAQEKAAFIVMGIKEEAQSSLGKAVWKATEKSNIPIILIPREVEFTGFQTITIAIDAERKLQKMPIVRSFAKKFHSTINLFVENSPNATSQAKILNAVEQVKENLLGHARKNLLGHARKNLNEHPIPFTETHARNTRNFAKHLCKFASKKSDLLIIEVEPGKIDTDVKNNIEILLNVNQKFPVLFVKTQMIGNGASFN